MIVRLQWMEPESGQCLLDVPLTEQEANDLQNYLVQEGGGDYGVTIPSMSLVKKTKKNPLKVDMQGLADSVRYSTGENIFCHDFPLFLTNGIVRS